MQRAVTAIYRTHALADLVRQELEAIGIGRGQIAPIPVDDASSTSPPSDDDAAMNQRYDLNLPDDDLRTYQQALRNGDHVVSVDLDDEERLARVLDIMRRPEEARNLDELDREHAASTFRPYREPTGTPADRRAGRRDATQQ